MHWTNYGIIVLFSFFSRPHAHKNILKIILSTCSSICVSSILYFVFFSWNTTEWIKNIFILPNCTDFNVIRFKIVRVRCLQNILGGETSSNLPFWNTWLDLSPIWHGTVLWTRGGCTTLQTGPDNTTHQCSDSSNGTVTKHFSSSCHQLQSSHIMEPDSSSAGGSGFVDTAANTGQRGSY